MAKLPNLLKRKSGTSLNAQGFAPTPKLESESGSSRPIVIRETVPELSSRSQSLRVYSRMLRDDASVDVSVRAWKTPLLGASYFIEPASENQIDVDIAEFVEFNVFHNINSPWLQVLQNIARFCEHGFSVLEPVWVTGEWAPRREKANRKTYTLLKKLAPRPASTITNFQYDDNGGPLGVKQNAIDKDGNTTEVDIPIDKLIILTLNGEGGDLEGKSVLRTAYPHWYYKTHLYKIDAIQKERHGIGVPKIKLPANASQKDRALGWELVRNLRTNENSGIVEPFGFEIEFAELSGNLVDALKSADHHNSMIMLNVMAQFLLQGMNEGGGRATSASQQDIYMKSLRYIADFICSCINLYLIPKMVAYNFPTDRYPLMKVRNIGETRDLQQMAAAVANVLDKEGITPDLPFEQWLRDVFGAPRKTEARPVAKAAISGIGNNGNDSSVGPTVQSGNMGKGNNPG